MVELASKAGLFLDPWQEFALHCALWERPSDEDDALWEWAAFEVGVLVPRQNGKGTILEAREVAGLFLFEEDLILHSAHEFKTSGEAFRRVKMVVENNPWMLKKVGSFSTAHGNEGIELKATPVIIGPTGVRTGGRVCRLRFVARTGGSARGFTANLVVWDEAFNLPETVVGAQLPTLSAVRNPQLWYTSSAVDKDVHAYGLTLARVRARALAEIKAIREGVRGGDGASYDEYGDLADDDGYGGLTWLEWAADEAAYAAAQAVSARQVRQFIAQVPQWQASNPGVGFRLRTRKIARELRAMGAKTFAVERLGLGDWPDVDADAGKVDMVRWEELADPDTRPAGRRIALAVEVSPDGNTAALASGSRREDGAWHVKVIDHRPGGGTAWVVQRIVDLVARYDVCAVLLNPASPAGSLVADLVEAGVVEWSARRPGKGGYRAVTMREYAQACGAFVADIRDVGELGRLAMRLRHAGQLVLTDALREAGTRNLADAWAWDHKTSGSDITTLVAATLAIHGFRVHGTEKGMVPWAEYV